MRTRLTRLLAAPMATHVARAPLVQALPWNEQGRDFVVGDVHGCFHLLDHLLDHVRFNPSLDRLFSVGDLVDRGPNSVRAAEFLAAPWFHAVRGNHESMLLDFFGRYLSHGRMDYWDQFAHSQTRMNGGEWVKHSYQTEGRRMTDAFTALLARMQDLPLILTVGTEPQRFHMVHAELVRPGNRSRWNTVWLDSDVDQWKSSQTADDVTRERVVWGRGLWVPGRPGVAQVQEGLSTTFCGHTIGATVRRCLSHVCLDTGAYRSLSWGNVGTTGFGLTMYSVHETHYFRTFHGCDAVLESRWG